MIRKRRTWADLVDSGAVLGLGTGLGAAAGGAIAAVPGAVVGAILGAGAGTFVTGVTQVWPDRRPPRLPRHP